MSEFENVAVPLKKLDDLLQKNPLNFIDNQISTKSLKEEFMDFK